MPIIWRRALFILFLLSFAVAAPSVVLYTAGFRLDFENIRLVRTGGLVIKSQPRQVTLTLNTETENISSPWRNDRLVPQNYRITLSRDGYFPWQKTLAVYSQRTTFIEDVILFPLWANDRITSSPAPQLAVAHGQNILAQAVTSPASSTVTIIESGRDQTISNNIPGLLLHMEWSPHGERLLLHTNNTTTPWWMWDRLANNWYGIDEPWLRTSPNLFWHQSNDFILAGRTATTTVRAYHLALKTTTDYEFSSTSTEHYILNDDGLYLLWDTKNQSHLSLIDHQGQSATIASWPYHHDYALVTVHRDHLYVRDRENLYAINLTHSQHPTKKYHFQHLVADDRFGDLLWNEHNIYTLDPNSQQTSFLARFGDEITGVWWHSSGRYVIVAFSQSVAMVELDARDRRNIHVYELPQPLEQLVYWARDQVLLMVTTNGGQPELWRQPLILE